MMKKLLIATGVTGLFLVGIMIVPNLIASAKAGQMVPDLNSIPGLTVVKLGVPNLQIEDPLVVNDGMSPSAYPGTTMWHTYGKLVGTQTGTLFGVFQPQSPAKSFSTPIIVTQYIDESGRVVATFGSYNMYDVLKQLGLVN